MSFFVVMGLLLSAGHTGLAIGWNADGAHRITLCKGATIVTLRLTEDGTVLPDVSVCPDALVGLPLVPPSVGLPARVEIALARSVGRPSLALPTQPNATNRARAPPLQA
ncbi:MAG: hypothetical protein AAFR93_04325 [Pseudomonadota bacterium]